MTTSDPLRNVYGTASRQHIDKFHPELMHAYPDIIITQLLSPNNQSPYSGKTTPSDLYKTTTPQQRCSQSTLGFPKSRTTGLSREFQRVYFSHWRTGPPPAARNPRRIGGFSGARARLPQQSLTYELAGRRCAPAPRHCRPGPLSRGGCATPGGSPIYFRSAQKRRGRRPARDPNTPRRSAIDLLPAAQSRCLAGARLHTSLHSIRRMHYGK